MDFLIARAKLIQAIRTFFTAQDFLETDTPSLVLSPGMEPHIRPLKVENTGAFLPTSPEFAMKRLLARGYDRIFQVCKAYRAEPLSTTHNPEFTILEWYRAHSGYEAIMNDVEDLFVALAQAQWGTAKFETQAYGIQDVSRPWPRFTVEECFRKFAGIELTELRVSPGVEPGAWDDQFFRIMLNDVEPALAKLGKPCIIYQYPESQAALSNIITDARGFRWGKRFEVYAGGLELGNAFDELADPIEQRRRFEKDMKLRTEIYGDQFPPNPIDEAFLKALSLMPPSGGIAMGVDRLVMYFTGATDIGQVLWLPSQWGAANNTH
jgi:lysyl-tRNA synthetase class 2